MGRRLTRRQQHGHQARAATALQQQHHEDGEEGEGRQGARRTGARQTLLGGVDGVDGGDPVGRGRDGTKGDAQGSRLADVGVTDDRTRDRHRSRRKRAVDRDDLALLGRDLRGHIGRERSPEEQVPHGGGGHEVDVAGAGIDVDDGDGRADGGHHLTLGSMLQQQRGNGGCATQRDRAA